MPVRWNLPPFLEGSAVTRKAYARWLKAKAKTHCGRDCKRGNTTATAKAYREAIHAAVMISDGLCHYTGEPLRWDLIGLWNDEDSKKGRRVFKAKFADLPTLDHVGDGLGAPDFVICGWVVNDAKGDLSLADYLTLCKKVLKHHHVCPDEGTL
jgi:hypothetical protein